MLDYFKNISSDEDSEDSYITYTFYAFFTILTFLIFYFLFIYGTNNNNIQNSDIITYILTSVFIITVIYYLIFHQNIYNKMVYNYYAIQYQLIDVYNADINYYTAYAHVLFSFYYFGMRVGILLFFEERMLMLPSQHFEQVTATTLRFYICYYYCFSYYLSSPWPL